MIDCGFVTLSPQENTSLRLLHMHIQTSLNSVRDIKTDEEAEV